VRTDPAAICAASGDDEECGGEGETSHAQMFIGFLFGDATVSSIKGSSKITFIEVTLGDNPDLIRDGC
jgi:hypothetical protein